MGLAEGLRLLALDVAVGAVELIRLVHVLHLGAADETGLVDEACEAADGVACGAKGREWGGRKEGGNVLASTKEYGRQCAMQSGVGRVGLTAAREAEHVDFIAFLIIDREEGIKFLNVDVDT